MPRAKREILCASCGQPFCVERLATTRCGACYPAYREERRAANHKQSLLALVAGATDEACIDWPRSRDPKGYGIVSFGGRSRRAHRVIYELTKGPIPAGAVVMHRCDNPGCVNPLHLTAGSQRENIADADRKGRRPNCGLPGLSKAVGRSNPSAKLTEQDVLAIRASKEPRPSLASRFGVSVALIAKIRNRSVWSHLP